MFSFLRRNRKAGAGSGPGPEPARAVPLGSGGDSGVAVGTDDLLSKCPPRQAVQRRRRSDRWRPVTRREHEALYWRPDSFTDLLPWVDYDPEHRAFLLEDGFSVGALFELRPVSAEARPAAFMEVLQAQVQAAVCSAVPEEEFGPWVVQVYVQDEQSLGRLGREIAAYGQSRGGAGSEFSRHWFALLDEHLRAIGRPGGLFSDELVTGGPWRGQWRRVRVCLYRRYDEQARAQRRFIQPLEELGAVAHKFTAALEGCGVGVRRCGAVDLHDWLVPWFNPAPPFADSPEHLLELGPYPGDEPARPFGRDLAQLLTYSLPRADLAEGLWWFDELPHEVVTVQDLRGQPRVGHFTAEQRQGDHTFALFDRCPEGTVMVMTLVIKPQDLIQAHLDRIRNTSHGENAEAEAAHDQAVEASRAIEQGNKLYPVVVAFYLRGSDRRDLERKRTRLSALLVNNNLQPIAREADLLLLDSYVRHLPMAWDALVDRLSRRSRLMFSTDIAALLPLYGRSTGTGHPGCLFFNRGAEPLLFDPLEDRKKNAHMFVVGPPGSGKSAYLVYQLLQTLALHRPRVFIVDAGNSFGLMLQYLAARGLSVNQVSLDPGSDTRLPPFASALRLLDGRVGRGGRLDWFDDEALLSALEIEERHQARDGAGKGLGLEAGLGEEEEDTDDEQEKRDPLGEMEAAARIMITGGDEREDARMTRPDRLLIRKAILSAARRVRDAGGPQVLTRDVVAALRRFSDDQALPAERRHRAYAMADGLELFCSGLAGDIFDRPGKLWPEADVTLVELGVLARGGYEDLVGATYISLMANILNQVERDQYLDRHTLMVTDEAHIPLSIPIVPPYMLKFVKMLRKLGCWTWMATQNTEDLADSARRMLNMLEWWICLTMPKDEVSQIRRFRDLTEEQTALLLSAHKVPGHYAEGVVMSDHLTTLFRSVPPPIALALAQTEKHEKAARAALMREHGISELEAAERVARQMTEGRR